MTRPDLTEFVCEHLGVDCTTVADPVIVSSGLLQYYQMFHGYVYGLTFGREPYIHVNPDLSSATDPTREAVIVHETTHYVLWVLHDGEVSQCESERVARVITADFMQVEYDDSWRLQYGCD